MKLGLHIGHSVYDAGTIPHEDYPDDEKNGVTVSVKVVVGDFYHFHWYDKNVMSFKRSAEVLDKDINRLANDDDADFAFFTKLQEEMKTSDHPEQAILLHTLLEVVKSDILTSPSRVTEEYREQQKKKDEAEKAAREKKLQAEREKYKQAQLKIAEQQRLETQENQKRISAYLHNITKYVHDK